MIYLKKLSTAFDEEQSHKNQLEELKSTIEKYNNVETNKRKELKKLEEDKRHHKEEQDKEITALREQLAKIKREEEDRIAELEARVNKSILDAKNQFQDKYNTKSQLVKDERAALGTLETKNYGDAQKTGLDEMRKVYERYAKKVTETYDSELEKESQSLERKQKTYDEVHNKLQQVSEDYRKVKHQKEVNEVIEKEWAIKVEVVLQLTQEIPDA